MAKPDEYFKCMHCGRMHKRRSGLIGALDDVFYLCNRKPLKAKIAKKENGK